MTLTPCHPDESRDLLPYSTPGEIPAFAGMTERLIPFSPIFAASIPYILLIHYIWLFVLLSSILIPLRATGQEVSSDSLKSFFDQKFKSDSRLISGDFYQVPSVRSATEHPFLDNPDWKRGYVVIGESRFDNLLLRYDIYSNLLVLNASEHTSAFLQVALRMDRVRGFTMGGRIFRQYPDGRTGADTRFCEVLSAGPLELLVMKSKRLMLPVSGSTGYVYETSSKWSLLVNDSLIPYQGKRTLFRLHPELKGPLKEFLRSSRGSGKRESDSNRARLVTYCNSLLPKEPALANAPAGHPVAASVLPSFSYRHYADSLKNISGLLISIADDNRNKDVVSGALNEENPSRPHPRFGTNTYEKNVQKVVAGNKNAGQNNRQSYLTGRITNKANGEPVIGAALYVKESGQGVISDGNGSFALPAQAGTTFNLTVSCLGMKDQLFLVDMLSSGILNIEMDSRLIDVKEVVVRSDQYNNIRGMQMGFQSVGIQEIKTIPMVMGERDILKIATLMPGVQTIGEGSAGFNVRGSSSDQNLFLINDIPVLNTGHLFGFFSAFNPDIVSGFNLYKSNFPVEFGGRLASVFDINTRKGNKKTFGARGSISPITGSILVEAPVVKEKVSVMVSARSTYSDWILNRLEDARVYNRHGSFYDLMSGVHIIGKNNSSWQLFGYYSSDRFSLSTTNEYKYQNTGASAIFNKRLKEKWSLKAAAVFSRYSNYQANRVQASRAFEHPFTVQSQELKASVTGYPAARHRVGFGGSVILHSLDHGILNPLGVESLLLPTDFGQESGLESALFAFDEFSVTDRFTLYTGLRYSHFTYLSGPDTTNRSYSGPEYRVSLNFMATENLSVKMSYNKMRQYLFMLSNTASISPTDRWKLADPSILPPVSDQFSLGLYKNFPKSSLETSAEVYYKIGQNSIDYRDGADLTFNPDIPSLLCQGNQRSYGAEFLLKKNAGRLTGWISYTWSRSFITINGSLPADQINLGQPYPANYDKPHSLNLVGNFRISRRISLSSNLVYSSGRPATYPTGYFYVNRMAVVNYSLRNEYRIPDYFRIDMAINLEGNLLKKKIAHGTWSFSVYNLTGRNNAYSVYFVNGMDRIRGYKLSIYGVPVYSISYNFKLGNYATD